MAATAGAPPSINHDAGNIAIIEDSDGVVARPEPVQPRPEDLAVHTLGDERGAYGYSVAEQGYDCRRRPRHAPRSPGRRRLPRQSTLPFSFPFFGAAYNQVYVNSDGNLTFTAGGQRFHRPLAGPHDRRPAAHLAVVRRSRPRGPQAACACSPTPARVVVSWVAVPEWQATGVGTAQTFQVRLYPDGRIEFSYSGVDPPSAVVGIAPGNLKAATTLVDFRNDPGADYSAAVAERFGDTLEVDIVTAAQKFYQTHDDSYDYLVIYNNMADPGAGRGRDRLRKHSAQQRYRFRRPGARCRCAVRFGLAAAGDDEHGVHRRRQPAQYPVDPNGVVPPRKRRREILL